MVKRNLFLVICLISMLVMNGCVDIPNAFDVNVETSSELGPDTLSRIDEINETIASGVEVGPDTRDLIRELNQTIKDGVKAGFDEDTLSRVDNLIRVVEDGLKIGLDAETLVRVDELLNTIDAMPGNWEASAGDIIRLLEGSAGSLAGNMANEVKDVIQEARVNIQQMTASAGAEFRCNVDFLGSKAGASLQEFIGKSIIGKIRTIVSGKSPENEIPIPWVCQVIPDQVDLIQVGSQLYFEKGIVTLTGYNYTDQNTPSAYVVDEIGNRVDSIKIFPYRASPYQIQLNLQGLDFTPVPPRSRIVFAWPNVAETSGIAILLPGNFSPVASYQMTPTSGTVPLTVNFTDTSTSSPTQWQWIFGDGATSNEQNPVHIFTENRAYTIQLTVSNALGSSTISQVLDLGNQLAADFSFSPRNGKAPIIVQFSDQSSGNPTSWLWDFGDGETSTEQNPEHVYFNPNPSGYSVSLHVTSSQGTNSKTSPDKVIVKEKLDSNFTSDITNGFIPVTVQFTDTSSGTNIVSHYWEFGDGTTSNETNPTHIYSEVGMYDVKLTVTDAEGETNTEVKGGNILASNMFLLLQPQFKLVYIFNSTSVYFQPFSMNGNSQLDSGISSDKYVCGIVGLQALNGDIQESSRGDILQAYMFKQYSAAQGKNTWWIYADFRSQGNEEKWVLDTFCMDRATENEGFIYRDNFRGIEGGKPYTTDISTEDYFSCNLIGLQALNGDINESGVQEVIVRAYMDNTSSKWKIVADFASHGTNEKWNANVLCFKKGSHLITEKPTFYTETFYFPANSAHKFGTGLSTTDYLCGVGGFSAEYGDINEKNSHDILKVHLVPEGNTWWIYADFSTHLHEEDWRVDVFCVSRNSSTVGPPPTN